MKFSTGPMKHLLSLLLFTLSPVYKSVWIHRGKETLIFLPKQYVLYRDVGFACLHCIETWNVRSMNQGKLEVVKQEMAIVNVDILGFNELKWTGMGEFNSDDHCIYYCGQESLRRNGVAIMVNKRVLKCSTWMQSQKRQNDLCSFPRQTIQYHSNPSLCPNQ